MRGILQVASYYGPEISQNQIDTSKLFCGTAASPLLVNGRLIVQIGSDIHGGQVLGLNPATGATEWEWHGLGPGYASPVVIELSGNPQIVTMTEGSIVGLDGKTGSELWSVPFPDEWHENISTPSGPAHILSSQEHGREHTPLRWPNRPASGRRPKAGRIPTSRCT